MATIGLDKLYYATITEDPETGEEAYAAPKQLAKAISAELSVEVAEAILYADDGASEIVKEFKSGTLTLGVDDLGGEAAAALTGQPWTPTECLSPPRRMAARQSRSASGRHALTASTSTSGCTG